MSENFEADVYDYLLGHMEAGRRAAFEQELERDPAARLALKEYADSLAGFACSVAAAEPFSANDHRSALSAIVAVTHPEGRAGKTRTWFPWVPVLAAAAVVLFLLNLVQFDRPLTPGFIRQSSDTAKMSAVNRNMGPSQAASSSPEGAPADQGPGRKSDQSKDGTGHGVTAMEEARREIERLRGNVGDLERSQRRLRAEYDALLDRIVEGTTAAKSLQRLNTMELVDAGSYDRGERKGLVDVGRGILTEPGVVVVPDQSGPPPASAAGVAPVVKPPYAWSVFDEKEHQGYLNLYNTPTVAADQVLQVWVRPVDATTFQPVAVMPTPTASGSGTVQYTLPAGSTPPAEVLVTIEPRQGTPSTPTGATVVRGP